LPTAWIRLVSHTSLLHPTHSLTHSGDNVDIVIWSIIEVTCAIICGSLPTLRPLLQKVPGLISSARASEYFGGGVSAASATQ
jgi:hypothetical protein